MGRRDSDSTFWTSPQQVKQDKAMNIAFIILAIICAYLIGSFPSGYIASRVRKGIDIREVGSRNMGAMNVFYKV